MKQTRFVWKDGTETWHVTAAYWPEWEIVKDLVKDPTPHHFVLIRQGADSYYLEK